MIFQYAKEAEMKEMLGNLADGEIEFYKTVSFGDFVSQPTNMLILHWKAMEEWDRIIPVIQRIRVDI